MSELTTEDGAQTVRFPHARVAHELMFVFLYLFNLCLLRLITLLTTIYFINVFTHKSHFYFSNIIRGGAFLFFCLFYLEK